MRLHPHAADASFLEPATEQTTGIWGRTTAMHPAELERGGVYDVDPSTPSTIRLDLPLIGHQRHETEGQP